MIRRSPLTAHRLHQEWLSQPCVTMCIPRTGTRRCCGIAQVVGTAGNRVRMRTLPPWPIEHGATLCSADEDFGRFSRFGLDGSAYGYDTGVTRGELDDQRRTVRGAPLSALPTAHRDLTLVKLGDLQGSG